MAGPRRLVETRPSGHDRVRGLVSSRTSGRRIDARGYRPSDDLADVVATLWCGAWDLRGQPSHVTEMLSDPCVNLVFEAGRGPHGTNRVVGVWTKLWRRELADRGRVRGVKLRAGALQAFVPAPAHRFANRIVPLTAIFGDAILGLEHAVLAPVDDAEAFAIFEDWLRTHRRPHDSNVGLAVEGCAPQDPPPALVTSRACPRSRG